MNFQLNKVYTFNTRAPAFLGTSIKNAKMIGMVDYHTAKGFDNIDLKFRQIYPTLPNGTPDDPQSCVYYSFISESGEKIILADQWIDMDSIEIIEHINFQVNFVEATIEDMTHVRNALNAMNYTNFTIKQL